MLLDYVDNEKQNDDREQLKTIGLKGGFFSTVFHSSYNSYNYIEVSKTIRNYIYNYYSLNSNFTTLPLKMNYIYFSYSSCKLHWRIPRCAIP
jgi:hypothetical protein